MGRVLGSPNSNYRWQRNPRKLLLFEGDSWFNYYLKFLSVRTDLATGLSKYHDIYSFAMFGDTVKNMTIDGRVDYIVDKYNELCNNVPKASYVKGFVFSGGGNDLIDNIGDLLDKSPEHINRAALTVKLNKMREWLKAYFITAYQYFPVPLFIHTYDYPYPDGTPYKSWFTKVGPWLKPKLQAVGVSTTYEGSWVMRDVIDAYVEMLCQLKTELSFSGVPLYIIELRGTLGIEDWSNEIHYNGQGKDKLVERFETQMEPILEKALVI